MTNIVINKKNGFTLIEIMVVLVIIAIMASFIVPSLINRPEQARMTKVKNDILTIESALDLYKLDNAIYPDLQIGLRALVEDENNMYLKRLPSDPWGSPYQYKIPGEYGAIDIFSFGADGKKDGSGKNKDIGNWNLED